MARNVGIFFYRCFVCCRPGSCRGNMERIVAGWQHPVASSVAMVMQYWVMPRVLLQCIRMAIKMARNGGTFVRCCRFFVC